jgi:G protein-coupled receptor 139
MSNSSLLVKFSDSYADFHGWISLILCLFGIPFNIFIIIILRRTKIATFAINLILICIAICDSITMLVYVPYCIHFYIIHSNSYSSQASPSRDNYFWTIYLLINIFISITFHSLSIWLTVYLALYRYFYIKESVSRITNKGSNVKSKNNKIIEFFLKKSKHAIFLIFIFCLLFCMPTYFFPTIKFNHVNSTNSSKESIIYYVDQSYLNIITNGFVFKASFYGQAVFAKILPCILLVTFIYLLIHSLLIVKQNKKDLNFDKKKVNF